MKIAIIHDVFLYMGGAERVALALLRMFPDADVYTAAISKEANSKLQRVTSGRIISSPFRWFPEIHKLPILFWWKTIDLSSYDLVISSSHSFSAKSVRVKKPTIHVSYIHSPPRYLYGLSNQQRWIRASIFRPLLALMRRMDVVDANRPDALIANSKTVQSRIRRWYGRKSTVVYPPVNIPKKIPKRTPRYYVCFSHLLKQKYIEIAIEACNKLNIPLVVVGTGPEEKNLRAIAGKTIRFLGFVPDERISEIYASATALLCLSLDEDFGMVPVEAMAQGVPVIGYRCGGVRETVIEGKTGVLFHTHTVRSLINGIKRLKRKRFAGAALRRQAQKFSERRFQENINNLLATVTP